MTVFISRALYPCAMFVEVILTLIVSLATVYAWLVPPLIADCLCPPPLQYHIRPRLWFPGVEKIPSASVV